MPESRVPHWDREYWAGLHLLSAANLTRHSYSLEQEMLRGERSETNVLLHRACVVGAIFTSVAFLEATANEFFADATDDLPGLKEIGIRKKSGMATGVVKGLSEQVLGRLGNLWNLGVPRRASYSVLDKFKIALALADKEPIDHGTKPYQEVQLLVKLRNEWIHFEPGWRAEHDEVSPHGIEVLEGHFSAAPSRSGDPGKFSLHHCISHGCAEWGVLSAVNFADEFFKKMGSQPNFESLRSKLVTL